MGKLISLFFPLAFCSCSTSYNGTYYSACYLYGKTEAIVHLKENKEFEYNFVYGYAPIKGTWKVLNDTIILNSKEFTVSRDTLAPKFKFNYNNDTTDRFVFKNNKIFPLVRHNTVDKRCFLVKKWVLLNK